MTTFKASAFKVTASDGVADTSGYSLSSHSWKIYNKTDMNTVLHNGTGTVSTDKTVTWTPSITLDAGTTYTITITYTATGLEAATGTLDYTP